MKLGRSVPKFCDGLLRPSAPISDVASFAVGKRVKRAAHSSPLGGVGLLADPPVVEVFATGVALAEPVDVEDTFAKS